MPTNKPGDTRFLSFDNIPESFFKYGREVQYDEKEIVVASGETPKGFHLVLSGLVRSCYQSGTGVIENLIYLEPGSIFGEADVFFEIPSRYYFETVENTRLLFIDRESMIKLFYEDPQAALFLYNSTAYKMEYFQRNYDNVCHRSSMYLTCSTLIDLAYKYGAQVDGKLKIDYAVSHQYIAELIGVSRLTVTKNFSRLKEKSLLVKMDEYYCITDMEGLIAFRDQFS